MIPKYKKRFKKYIELTDEERKLLRDQLLRLSLRKELSDFLCIPYKRYCYLLFVQLINDRYIEFKISKKSGGERTILSPNSNIKYLQSQLNTILQCFYQSRSCSHGFVSGKSIKTNSINHVGKKYVLNIDLFDFFTSIHIGRVIGILKKIGINESIANDIANICCYKNPTTNTLYLPQGSPTSPVITNLICYSLDSKLVNLAKQYRASYSRYADDITFSHNNENIINELNLEIRTIIVDEGFQINESKFRINNRNYRQVVTGLTVNKKVNLSRKFLRNLRATLHCWQKYGYQIAESKHLQVYKRQLLSGTPELKRVVKGRLEFIKMIRGENDPVYIKYFNIYTNLLNGYKGLNKHNEDLSKLNDFKKHIGKHYSPLINSLKTNLQYDDLVNKAINILSNFANKLSSIKNIEEINSLFTSLFSIWNLVIEKSFDIDSKKNIIRNIHSKSIIVSTNSKNPKELLTNYHSKMCLSLFDKTKSFISVKLETKRTLNKNSVKEYSGPAFLVPVLVTEKNIKLTNFFLFQFSKICDKRNRLIHKNESATFNDLLELFNLIFSFVVLSEPNKFNFSNSQNVILKGRFATIKNIEYINTDIKIYFINEQDPLLLDKSFWEKKIRSFSIGEDIFIDESRNLPNILSIISNEDYVDTEN